MGPRPSPDDGTSFLERQHVRCTVERTHLSAYTQLRPLASRREDGLDRELAWNARDFPFVIRSPQVGEGFTSPPARMFGSTGYHDQPEIGVTDIQPRRSCSVEKLRWHPGSAVAGGSEPP